MNSPVSEPNETSGSTWLRWGLVFFLILAGVILALILGPESESVVQLQETVR